jgi:potassium efflux system protein
MAAMPTLVVVMLPWREYRRQPGMFPSLVHHRRMKPLSGVRPKAFRLTVAIFCVLLAAARAATAGGQEEGRVAALPIEPRVPESIASPIPAELTIEVIHRRMSEAEAALQVDEAARTKVRELYQLAVEELRQAAASAAAAAAFAHRIEEAPKLIEQLKLELGAAPPAPVIEPPANASLSQLEERVAQARAALEVARQQLTELEAEPKRRATRRIDIPKLTVDLRQRLADIERQLALAPIGEPLAPLALAQRTVDLARKLHAERSIAALEKEAAAYEATVPLLPLRLDRAVAELAARDRAFKAVQEAALARRTVEVAEQENSARREAAAARPEVQPLAERTARHAEERKELDRKLASLSSNLATERKIFEDLQKDSARIREKVDAVGLTNAIGLMLRKMRSELPDAAAYRARSEAWQGLVRASHLRLLELQDLQTDLAPDEQRVHEIMSAADPELNEDERAELEVAIRDLIRTERQYLASLISDYNVYFESLVEVDATQQHIIQETERLSAYIDERILWIRSTHAVGPEEPRRIWETLRWLASPAQWRMAAEVLWADARRNPAAAALLVAFVAALFYMRGRVRRRLEQLGETTGRVTLAPALRATYAFLLTAVVASLWPGIMALVGWRLQGIAESTTFSRAVGSGLLAASQLFFLFEFTRQICRGKGLAGAHFRWPAGLLGPLRRWLLWLTMAVVPLAFLVGTTEAYTGHVHENAVGRLAFALSLACVAALAHAVLRPRGTIMQLAAAENDESFLVRLSWLWYAIGVGVPLLLAFAAAAGYYYTADRLAWRLQWTAWLLLALLVASGIIFRWLLMARLLLTREAMQRRRAEREESPEPAREPPAHPEREPAPPRPQEPDPAELAEQTRRLLNGLLGIAAVVGVWMIWSGVLPALGMLRNIPLWTTAVAIDGVEKIHSVTIADAALALLVGVVTYMAVRNLPGLLEMTVLRRLPLDPGGRYAVAAIFRYALGIAGVVITASMIGISWSKVQWLAAAITVGLGFGLQEIFGNFVSGLILLLERPVRVGDIVTVGDLTGTVARIQMRATTIRDWDNRELLVPNKELITGRVVNWTLSDSITRVVFPVGVAYGTDTERARQLLIEVANRSSIVAKEPAPSAVFLGFGDSTLKLELRVYIPERARWLDLMNELNTSIDKAFREARIEIAFPQRDLHVRSVNGPLTVLMSAAGDGNDPQPGNSHGSQASPA